MRTLIVVTLLIAPLHTASAQWRLSLRHASATVTGFSRDDASTAEALSFLPDRPSNYTVTIGRDLGRARLAIEVGRTTADLALRGEGTTIVTQDAIHASTVAAELGARIAGVAGRPTVHASIALVAEHWDFDVGASDPRWRASARAALELDVPIHHHWSGILRGEFAAGPSLFKAAELPEGYKRKLGVRRGMAVGVGWGW